MVKIQNRMKPDAETLEVDKPTNIMENRIVENVELNAIEYSSN
jgi:hypothetical protein